MLGGGTAQFSVAKASCVQEPGSDLFSIQSSVSSCLHWRVDTMAEPHRVCGTGCCLLKDEEGLFAQEVPALNTIMANEADSIAAQVTERFDFDANDHYDDDDDDDDERATRAALGGTVNMNSLARFRNFLRKIAETADRIASDDEQNREDRDRQFSEIRQFGLIVKGRRQKIIFTPPMHVAYEYLLRNQTQAQRTLSLQWPMHFARIRDVRYYDPCFDFVELEQPIETLIDQVVCGSDGWSSVSVPRASKFLVDMLAALLILHRNKYSLSGAYSLVKCGFSQSEGTWKLTLTFLSPFSEEGAAADVYRLGMLWFDQVYGALHNHVFMGCCEDEDEASAEAAKRAFLKLESLIADMKDQEAQAPISVLAALKRAHEALLEADHACQYYGGTSYAFAIESLIHESQSPSE